LIRIIFSPHDTINEVRRPLTSFPGLRNETDAAIAVQSRIRNLLSFRDHLVDNPDSLTSHAAL
jgi:hypothetical protein